MQLDSHHSTAYAGLAVDDFGETDARRPLALLHGLTFDRTMWRPALAELETIDPGRRAIAFDLPGHGDSPDAPSYSLASVVERVHTAIVEAGLQDPVLVGHSASAATVAMYASQYPTAGAVEVEGTFLVAPFASMVQSLEPVLRGPGFFDAWSRIAANVFGLAELPHQVRSFVETTSRPRQDIVLGYWQDLLSRAPADLDAWVTASAAALRETGVPVVSVVGHEPSSPEVEWLRANLPDARTLVWPASGHFPHLAHPHRFAELLAETGTRSRPVIAASAAG